MFSLFNFTVTLPVIFIAHVLYLYYSRLHIFVFDIEPEIENVVSLYYIQYHSFDSLEAVTTSLVLFNSGRPVHLEMSETSFACEHSTSV